jgi:hypothetical protein
MPRLASRVHPSLGIELLLPEGGQIHHHCAQPQSLSPLPSPLTTREEDATIPHASKFVRSRKQHKAPFSSSSSWLRRSIDPSTSPWASPYLGHYVSP